MQCQICSQKTATIHLTEITDGARTEMHICEQCAAEQGIAAQSQISINELLSNLLSAQPSDDELFGPSDRDLPCPNCGFTINRLRREGALGCPHDYEVFEKELLPLIEKAHNGKSSHCGKIPSKVPAGARKMVEHSSLKRQLDAAIKDEDYELAARLSDRIKELESE